MICPTNLPASFGSVADKGMGQVGSCPILPGNWAIDVRKELRKCIYCLEKIMAYLMPHIMRSLIDEAFG